MIEETNHPGQPGVDASVSARDLVLVATGVCKSYRRGHDVVEVLQGLDLEVERGTILAISGASGSGKSTLLNILGTLDHADAGTVVINGEPLDHLPSSKLAAFRAERLGFVFQFHHLLPEFSAEENVMIPLRIAGRSHPAARERARELLATTKSKVVDVALESGYQSLSLFNFMFNRRFGMSPGRWRQTFGSGKPNSIPRRRRNLVTQMR